MSRLSTGLSRISGGRCSIALLALVIAGCQQEGMPAPPEPVTAITSPVLAAEPSTLTTCSAVVADVKWDVHEAGKKVSGTQLWVGSSPDELKLFSSGGAQGEAKTGPWTRPGLNFVLKDSATGRTLGTIVVGGPGCR
jgi:hypothetical protein